jgi:hypothetical protein
MKLQLKRTSFIEGSGKTQLQGPENFLLLESGKIWNS